MKYCRLSKVPDFPTGGVIIGKMGIEEAYRTRPRKD